MLLPPSPPPPPHLPLRSPCSLLRHNLYPDPDLDPDLDIVVDAPEAAVPLDLFLPLLQRDLNLDPDLLLALQDDPTTTLCCCPSYPPYSPPPPPPPSTASSVVGNDDVGTDPDDNDGNNDGGELSKDEGIGINPFPPLLISEYTLLTLLLQLPLPLLLPPP